MRTGFFAFVFVIVFGFVSPSLAEQYGPPIGTAIPSSLTAQDQSGAEQRFATLVGSKGMTLVFTRSADWCPFCQAQLIDINDRAAEFEQAGYPVVSISYDPVEVLSGFSKKRHIEYTMLSDPNSDIIKAFGILNEEQEPGSFAYGIPHPGVFIVGKDKVIRAKFHEKDYKERPSIDDVLTSIRGLGHF